MNSKKKGDRGELELVHILEKRFGDGKFKRTPSSGAYTGGKNRELSKNLPFEAKIVLASDIITPMNFNFIIEHKFYNDISFWELFSNKSNWNQWIKQAEGDSKFVEKEPLIVIKYNRHKRICLIKSEVLKKYDKIEFIWKDYAIITLENLLKLPDEFWFAD
jgi:hypothetical protein